MGFKPSVGKVVGIAIGSAFGLFLLLSAVAILFFRYRHQRLLKKAATDEEKPSPFSSAEVASNTKDGDRLPRARSTFHESIKAPYAKLAGDSANASRTELEDEKTQTTKRDKTQDEIKAKSAAKVWPLPRRLTRSDNIPLARVRSTGAGISKETHKTAKGLPKISTFPEIKRPQKTLSKSSRQHPRKEDAAKHRTLGPSSFSKPRELQPRSVSLNAIPDTKIKTHVLNGIPQSQSVLADDQDSFHLALPRSSSLWNQDPGIVPSKPVPLLPIEGTLERLGKRRSVSENLSRGASEIYSDNTSMLDFAARLSAGESIAQAVSAAGHRISSPDKNPLLRMETPFALDSIRPSAVHSRIEATKSHRVSVQGSLPRSESSGISQSWLDHRWSRNISNTTVNRDAEDVPRSKLVPSGSVNRRKSRRTVSPSPLSNDATMVQKPDEQKRLAATSVLQVISGNEDSSKRNTGWDGNPPSFLSLSSKDWEAGIFTDLSRINGDENAVEARKSSPSANARVLTIEDKTVAKRDSPIQMQKPQRSTGPPSALKFDFQLQSSVATPEPPVTDENEHKSLSLSKKGPDEDDSPDSSPLPTPSHKPRHPHRLNAIIDSTAIGHAPMPDLKVKPFKPNSAIGSINVFKFSADLDADRERRVADEKVHTARHDRENVSISQFPQAPKRHPSHVVPHRTKSSMHQSRSRSSLQSPTKIARPPSESTLAPPPRSSSLISSPSHKSPSPLKGILKNGNNGNAANPSPRPIIPRKSTKRASKSLSTTIQALRRMNSEGSDSSRSSILSATFGLKTSTPGSNNSRAGHRRYLSLGAADDDGEDDEEDADDEDGDVFSDSATGTVRKHPPQHRNTAPAGATAAWHTPPRNDQPPGTEDEKQRSGDSLRTPRRTGSRWWKNGGINNSSNTTTPQKSNAKTKSASRASEKKKLQGPRSMPFFDAGTMLGLATHTGDNNDNTEKAVRPSKDLYDEDGFLRDPSLSSP